MISNTFSKTKVRVIILGLQRVFSFSPEDWNSNAIFETLRNLFKLPDAVIDVAELFPEDCMHHCTLGALEKHCQHLPLSEGKINLLIISL